MYYKVQVRRGPDGANVDYHTRLTLAEARRIAETLPPEGAAGIWNSYREVRFWYFRAADGTLDVQDIGAERRAELRARTA